MKREIYQSILILLFTGLIFNSCNEKMDYESQLVFMDNLDKNVEVKLYPNIKYQGSSFNMYRMSEDGNGYKDCEFSIGKNLYECVFYTSEDGYNSSPTEILKNVMDSIKFTMDGDTSFVFRFNHTESVNYKLNPFQDNNSWILRNYEDERPTSFQRNPVTVNEYTFTLESINFE